MHSIRLLAAALACAGGAWPALCAAQTSSILRADESSQAEADVPLNRRPVITAVAVAPGGGQVATAGDDHVVRIWSTATGQIVHKLTGHHDWVRALAYSPEGTLLASAGDDHRITLWQADAGEKIAELPAHPQVIYSIAFNPDGSQLAAVGFERTVRLYDVAKLQVARELEGPDDDLRSVVYSPDGTRLATGGRNGRIRIWTLPEAAPLRDITAPPRRIRTLAWLADGQKLVSAGEGRTVTVWDAATGEALQTLDCRTGKILAMVVCSEQLIATGGSDNVISVWNWQTQTQADRLVGHTGSVATLAFDRASGTIISGSYDTTVRVWRLPTGGNSQNAAVETNEESRVR